MTIQQKNYPRCAYLCKIDGFGFSIEQHRSECMQTCGVRANDTWWKRVFEEQFAQQLPAFCGYEVRWAEEGRKAVGASRRENTPSIPVRTDALPLPGCLYENNPNVTNTS